MKHNERHHLKDNELAKALTGAQEFVGPRAKTIGLAVVGILVIAGLAGGFMVMRQRSQSRGQELLAEALVALDARVVPASAAGAEGDAPAAAQFNATGTFSTEAAKLNAALGTESVATDGDWSRVEVKG